MLGARPLLSLQLQDSSLYSNFQYRNGGDGENSKFMLLYDHHETASVSSVNMHSKRFGVLPVRPRARCFVISSHDKEER